MKRAENIEARNLMETDPVTAQNDQKLSQIKSRMEENSLRAIPVVDSKNNLEGIIGYRDLIRHVQFNPKGTKLSKVMHQPPKFDEEDSLVELADLRINSGRKMVVNLKNGKLEGVISDNEFLEGMNQAEEIDDISTEDVESKQLETVFEQDSIEKARHKMLDNNFSRLPILDKDGKLAGIVRSTDILRTMVSRQSPESGGTHGGRKGSEVNISGGNEKDRMSDIPVKEIADSPVETTESQLSGSDAVERMKEGDHHEIIRAENGYPKSIVTLKDFVDYIESFAPGKTVLVSLIGLDVPEEKAAVHKKVRKQLQGSLGRKLRRPEELNLHIKKSEKDGKRHRYEIVMKLFSEHGQITINEEGWELLDAVDEALDELNTVVRKKKEKMTDHH